MNRLRLFGGAAFSAHSGPITGRAAQRHRIALLALLASTRRPYRSRDQLITLLWPTVDAERGRRLLSDSIYRINHAVGDAAILGTGDDVRLNRQAVASDVADFESAFDARDWMQAVAIHTGPFMDGFYLPHAPEFDQWMEIERAKFTRAASTVIESLAADARAAGRSAEALEWRHRLAAITPDDAFGSLAMPSGSTIAVLPFSSIGDAAAMSSFADGVSEEVMHALARNSALCVVSPRSAFAYRNTKLDVRALGRRLRVDWIVEGSVRRAGDRLRIVAQLTDAKNGYQAWSESFDRRSSDALAVQQEVASAIAARVVATDCVGVSARRASA